MLEACDGFHPRTVRRRYLWRFEISATGASRDVAFRIDHNDERLVDDPIGYDWGGYRHCLVTKIPNRQCLAFPLIVDLLRGGTELTLTTVGELDLDPVERETLVRCPYNFAPGSASCDKRNYQ